MLHLILQCSVLETKTLQDRINAIQAKLLDVNLNFIAPFVDSKKKILKKLQTHENYNKWRSTIKPLEDRFEEIESDGKKLSLLNGLDEWMQENVLQKMIQWKFEYDSNGYQLHEDSLIIEETIIDLNRKYKLINRFYGASEGFVNNIFENDAFKNCLANKLIFKKNTKVKLREYTFKDFIGLKKLVYDGNIDLYRYKGRLKINNLPNLEEINLPKLNLTSDDKKPIFNNLPKLRKITIGSIYYRNYNWSIFNSLPNLENVYITNEITFGSISYDKYPIATNINSNAVLHFTNEYYSYKDALKELVNKYKNTLGFKTITFQ